jgi:CrcB protein
LTWLAVAVGGAAGAVCRYLVDFVVSQRLSGVFPWGTWAVNITGALLVGLVAGLTATAGRSALWQAAAGVGVGFCGAYTTFSTFVYETLALVERRAWWEAAWNLASLVFGVSAAAGGWLVATWLAG